MDHAVQLRPAHEPASLPVGFGGRSRSGREIGFDSLGLLAEGQPVFGVCGEIHFTRLAPECWEEALYKAKAGGVNIVSAYVFWIHHEEERGILNFSGRRNLRRFVELCGKQGLYVILRVGPFCHGEVRNGGLPDWLYGMPFRVRSLDEGFLAQVRRWYGAVAGQVEGLLFADDGPVVGIQLDNEYMHSSAPWEATRGRTNEYVYASRDGDRYLEKLRELCRKAGLAVPFYTCTAWGGAACAPHLCLPLWGGYAYMPWMIPSLREGEAPVREDPGESGRGSDFKPPRHPLSREYLYLDARNPEGRRYHSYNPGYDPASRPFACCEMGAGMQVAYQYRFVADPHCADAMANVKAGSGCDFVGYYMYQGGTNPGPYLCEDWCPQLSYDFQAPLGENLQPRESYYRLRALHQTLTTFEKELRGMSVCLGDGGAACSPEDRESLRWSVRSDGERGFLFLNNFQDHAPMLSKRDFRLTLYTTKDGEKGEEIAIPRPGAPALGLDSGESGVLPFGFRYLGATLRYATAQILFETDNHLFCMRLEGMPALLDFGEHGLLSFEDGSAFVNGGGQEERVIPLPEGTLRVTVMSRSRAYGMTMLRRRGNVFAAWTDGELYERPEGLILHTRKKTARIITDPPGLLPHTVSLPAPAPIRLTVNVRLGDQPVFRREVHTGENSLLRVEYEGDAAGLYQDGRLAADHFHNGEPWDVPVILLDPSKELTLCVVPAKEDVAVSRDAMAAVREEAGRQHARLLGLTGILLYRRAL
ncbi:MAG: beta-galactosidase [Clostridia bacterium]|nr:beta-galactosidase [Clostridia bacterium]